MTLRFKLDASGDLDVARGALSLVDDVVQRVATRLRMLLGEWFLDTTDGTAYLQQILVKDANLELARTAIIDRVRATEGVRAVTSLTLDPDRLARKFSATVTCVGPTGPFTVSA